MFPFCCEEKVYDANVLTCMLHGSEIWSLKRELGFHWTEMRMIRWMCGVKLREKLSCIESRQQLGIEDIVKVVQRNRLRSYGRVLTKDDD